MSQEGNGRSSRTKTAIQEGMIRLLATYPLEKISISLLCKEANVSRTTFYHYYSIPEECYAEIMQEIMKKVDRKSREKARSAYGAMEAFVGEVKQHQRLFYTAYSLGFYDPIVQMSFRYNMAYIKDYFPNMSDFPDTYFKFCNYGMFGLISDWLAEGCPGNGEEILSFYRRFLNDQHLT